MSCLRQSGWEKNPVLFTVRPGRQTFEVMSGA
jgi:hypothetical protein